MTPRLRPGSSDRLAHAQSSGGGSRAAWVPEAMGLSRVRAVFFDLDNTLIDTAGASRRGMLEVTFLRRRPPLPGQPSAPSNPRQVPVELHSRAWGRVLDSELPRLQSRRHLQSPGLGRRGTRPPRPPLTAAPREMGCGGFEGRGSDKLWPRKLYNSERRART